MNFNFKAFVVIFCFAALTQISLADETRITSTIGDKKSVFTVTVVHEKPILSYESGDSRIQRVIDKKNLDFVRRRVLELVSGSKAIQSRNPASCLRDVTEVSYLSDTQKSYTFNVCLLDQSSDSKRVQDLLKILVIGL